MNPRPAVTSILVLCEGNHCRSPIAEALFRQSLPPEVSVQSAGLKALEGFAVHPEVIRLMAELGIDMTAHRGRQLTSPMALAADLILVMDEQQKDLCGRMVPGARGRIFLLGHWRPSPLKEISDPFQKGSDAFLVALEAIQLSVASWMPHVTQTQRSA